MNMYLIIEIRNYVKVKTFIYILEIDIFRKFLTKIGSSEVLYLGVWVSIYVWK